MCSEKRRNSMSDMTMSAKRSPELGGVSLVSSPNKSLSDGIPLQSKWEKFRSVSSLLLVTSVWIIINIWFAFKISGRLFYNPKKTLSVFAVLSHGSVFLLGALTAQCFEYLRWTLGSNSPGISLAAFLILGGNVGNLSVLKLFFSGQGLQVQKWCALKYSFNVMI